LVHDEPPLLLTCQLIADAPLAVMEKLAVLAPQRVRLAGWLLTVGVHLIARAEDGEFEPRSKVQVNAG
jgi:hypothetical protein